MKPQIFGDHLIGKGEKASRAKLTNKEVTSIRESIKLGYKNIEIAKTFNVDPSTICDIKSGKSWSHL